MRQGLLVVCLIALPSALGCQLQRKRPYERDPDLLYNRPSLTTSADMLAEKAANRKPTPPPMPTADQSQLADAKRSAKATPAIQLAKAESPDKKIETPPDATPAAPAGASESSLSLKPPPANAVEKNLERMDIAANSEIKPPTQISAPNGLETATHTAPTTVVASPRPSFEPVTGVAPSEPTRHDSVDVVKVPAEAQPGKLPALSSAEKLEPVAASLPPAGENRPEAANKRQNKYWHNDAYTQLQGVLEKTRGGIYSVRYCDPSEEDPHGGKVRLEDDSRFEQYQEGDIVSIEGEIVANSAIKQVWLNPCFRVKTIRKVHMD